MLFSAIVVFSVSSVSDFQRREDDAVAALVHGRPLLHQVWGHDPATAELKQQAERENAAGNKHPDFGSSGACSR
jgi:hypothetical protein